MLLLASCGAEPAPTDHMRLVLEQRDGDWFLTYELASPRPMIDLGPAGEHYRRRHWRMMDKDGRLIEREGRDVIVAAHDEPITRAQLKVEPAPGFFRKDYAPFVKLGENGLVLYTGHFIPYQDDGARVNSLLTLLPSSGASVFAFGESTPALKDWRSPFRHPAFLYVGPQRPRETDAVFVIIDDSAPDWVAAEIETSPAALIEALGAAIGRGLAAKPDLYLAIGDFEKPGRLSYAGDALPGQIRMVLDGGGWTEASVKARRILRRGIAHEAAHLWQASARPRSAGVPHWIHEGGAEALAAEAMLAAGYWTEADAQADLAGARRTCAAALGGYSLARAERDRNWDAIYACGHVLNVAAAGPEGAGALWNAFIARAGDAGYDRDLFLALAEERAGADAAEAIADFVSINDAQADRAIERLLEVAKGG